jgi:uncharacterized membrane protein
MQVAFGVTGTLFGAGVTQAAATQQGGTTMAQIHVIAGAREGLAQPAIRRIDLSDLFEAMARGFADFAAMPSHTIFLCLIYPLVGFFLGALTLGYNALPLFFPLAAGFAIIGPFAAVGLYEISRRRERGLSSTWHHAFDVFRSPALGSIAALGVVLMVLFLVWIATAKAIYVSLFGVLPPESIETFLRSVFTTREGWTLIFYGNAIGFLFAVVALSISVVSFPLLLDRDVGAAAAVLTSLRAVAANPGIMALWGLIVAALLLLGSLPAFAGLAVVMPVLGHATWHLYRRVVARDVAAYSRP